jgi:energy-coupling factor transporter ATP-binding protein EcfA2
MDYPPPHLADTIGILFQEPEAQLFNPTVEAEVAWGLENLGLPAAEIRARVAAALNLVKLERAAQRAPAELSGGEKKRLALASVLAMRPPIFILDEPMGGLDPMGRRQLLDALAHLSARDGGPRATVVMAESDPEAVAAFADRVVVLHQGRIAADGTPRDLFHSGESLAAMGIAAPQMAQVASRLNRRLGTAFDFVTVEEAVSPLAAYLG